MGGEVNMNPKVQSKEIVKFDALEQEQIGKQSGMSESSKLGYKLVYGSISAAHVISLS